MSNDKNNRILVLPFISGLSSNEALEIEHIFLLALEYKLAPISYIKFIDARIKIPDLQIVIEDGTYPLSAIRNLAGKFNTYYALTGKFDCSLDKIATQVYLDFYNIINYEVIAKWESPVGAFNYISEQDYNIELKNFNNFINTSAKHIVDQMGIEIDYLISNYLDTDIIENIEAFSSLTKAMKKTSTDPQKLNIINQVVKIDPFMEFGYMEKAKLYKKYHKYKDAIENYRLALENSLNDSLKAFYLADMGTCYMRENNFPEAVANLEKAIQIYPSYIKPYMNLALIHEENGNYTKAEEYFLDIQNIAPSDCRTYLGLARLYSKMESWQKAIKQYESLLKLDHRDAWSHSNIANCFLQLGKNKDAQSYLQKTIELDPDGEAGSYARQVNKALEEASKRDWWKFWRR